MPRLDRRPWRAGGSLRRPALLATLAALAVTACGAQTRPADARVRPQVRVDQIGFAAGSDARALLLAAAAPQGARFAVVRADGATVRTGALGRALGGWNGRYRAVVPLALGALPRGSYRVEVTSGGRVLATSPSFRVDAAAALYAPFVGNAVRFLRAQRDGAQVDPSLLARRPSHLLDAHAARYAAPVYRGELLAGALRPLGGTVDASGGWFDAGDYLKFFETASFSEVLLLQTLRDRPSAFPDPAAARAEARFGIDWLLRMWDPRRRRLAYQVGIGDGNAHVLGAHDVRWHLPQSDDHLGARPGSAAYYVEHRPAFVTSGPVSPNLAGRGAAAFALCAQVFATEDPALARRCLDAAQTLFGAARTRRVGRLTTAAPYDFYAEQEWRDDLELGAVEIARALAAGAGGQYTHAAAIYRRTAARWADAYLRSPLDGNDTLNLYDVAALAHGELLWTIDRWDDADLSVGRGELLADLHDQLALASRLAARDPFGLGYRYADGDVGQHALGLALEARIYDTAARSSSFAAFAQRQLDVVLGANAWGSSWIVGAGTAFPRCLHHQVANLAGSLDGRGPLLLGAAVPGPASDAALRGLGGAPEGARRCPAHAGDPYAPFAGRGARFVDAVAASPSVEPSDDAAALALAAFAQASGG
ncbi:MAG TPA: glycoside hydrolase family 9 protein [Conexibacter sp.]|jgi:endoglucanase|nr:glycoside hydrolase family 9 protein [Conexibacter sp.]